MLEAELKCPEKLTSEHLFILFLIIIIILCFKENGQRRYGGPPPGWDGPPPERGSEIFVGKLPRDLFEDELVPLCEKVRGLCDCCVLHCVTSCSHIFLHSCFSLERSTR